MYKYLYKTITLTFIQMLPNNPPNEQGGFGTRVQYGLLLWALVKNER